MILLLVRLLLFVIPIVFVVMWVRHRLNRPDGEGVEQQEEIALADRKMIRNFAVALGLMVVLALALYFGDSARDDAGKVFIPPHTVNGEVVPGRFVPADSPEAREARRKGQLPPAAGPASGEDDDG